MEKLKDIWNENSEAIKKYGLPAGGVALSLLTGTYAYKKFASGNPEYGGVDRDFNS